MEVILIKDMENLGYANDIVTVKPGYANNYLIPQGYAKAATASAKKVLAENQTGGCYFFTQMVRKCEID